MLRNTRDVQDHYPKDGFLNSVYYVNKYTNWIIPAES